MAKILTVLCALLIGGALIVEDAQAKRLGGGGSSGAQRSAPAAAPSGNSAKPAQQQAAPNAQQAAPAGQPAAAAQPAPSGFAKWAPMLGGLALGGLLGALFAGNGLGGILLLVVLGAIAFFVIRALMARRSGASQPVQYAGLNERVSMPMPQQPPASASPVASPMAAATAVAVPAGFDAAAFVRNAKMNFIRLQAANDAGNLDELREVATPEMFEALAQDVRTRTGGQHTDVMRLDAELLEVTTEQGSHWASVRFSGLIREAAGAEPTEFQEVWNLVKPADGSSGWLLAGIQQA